MPNALSDETIAIIKSTAPALQRHGLAITQRMYEHLFVDPEMEALFDQAAQTSGEQPKRLAAAILAYAQNIDRLEALGPAIDRMTARHVAAQVRPEHYPAVANALFAAMRDVLGDAATDTVIAAWTEAYWFLAEILIERETSLRNQAA